MDPLVFGGIATGIGTIVGLIGMLVAEGKYAEAQRVREQVAAEYGDVVLPELDAQLAKELGPSELSLIREDETLRDTQVRAMRKLEDLYRAGGTAPEDAAALRLADIGAQQRASSDYQSLMQGLAQRGQTMNPALAAAMAQQSSGAVLGATAQNRLQAQLAARDRALRALESSAGMAGDIRSADWQRSASKASANDAINRFNAETLMQTQWRNAELRQRAYENRLRKMQGQAQSRLGVAEGLQSQGERWASIGGGIGSGITKAGIGLAPLAQEQSERR